MSRKWVVTPCQPRGLCKSSGHCLTQRGWLGQAAEHYVLKVRWVKHGNAFKYQFYPGAALEDSQTVVFEVTIALWNLNLMSS